MNFYSIFVDLDPAIVNSPKFENLSFEFQTDFSLAKEKDEPKLKLDIPTGIVSVKGRLRKCVSAWKEINTPQFIIDEITQDNKIPLLCDLEPFKGRDNMSALKKYEFVKDTIIILKIIWIVPGF